MPLRLAGTVDGRPVSLVLPAGVSVLGSTADCDLLVDHPTVSRRHAELRVDGEQVVVRDLGSRNGVWVAGERVREATAGAGTAMAFGRVRLTVEEVTSLDLEVALPLGGGDAPVTGRRTRTPADSSTVALRVVEGFAFTALPGLLQLAEAGADELALAQAAARRVFDDLPALAVRVAPTDAGAAAVLFEARREVEEPVSTVTLEAVGAELVVRVEVPRQELVAHIEPLLGAISAVLRLAARGRGEVRAPTPRPAPPLPDPPTLVPAVRRVYEDAARVAQGDVGVLICGESGTGKEVLARFLHAASPRSAAPFVALNCAALPKDLLEAELFGVERGVATGVEARPGTFELAHGGTLLLDEIADMALETQAKILRVLQEGEVYRLGAAAPRPARCRVVAATNRDMDALRASGHFREDLYYRVATWVVELPPLRHRRADIPNLAAHFLTHAASRRGIRVRGISRRALDALLAYRWPGNIRQLENEMARAALFLSDGDVLEANRLGPELLAGGGPEIPGRLDERLALAERREILRALAACGGVATAAAELLGVSRSTLYRRMSSLGLELPGS